MNYVLGLDIGITSVGWTALEMDDKGRTTRILDLGVRGFNAAEQPKTGAPLAEPRRLARSARRRLSRREGRLRRTKDLFLQRGLLQPEHRESAFEAVRGRPSPWQLRAEGLDRRLTGEELARALFHIVKRRGFKSNRKKVKKSEDGEMLKGIGRTRELMAEAGYRTAGEMFHCAREFQERKRNTFESYVNAVDRETLEHEIITLFQRQREMGSAHAGAEFENELLEVFRWQKPTASGDDIIKMVGYCTFEKGDPPPLRAPRHSYHAERFNLLSKLNNLSYTVNGDTFRLTPEQRARIVERAYATPKLSYARIRKELGLPEEARFRGLQYMKRPARGQPYAESLDCENPAFVDLKGYHSIRIACEKAGVWDQVRDDPDLMDDLAYALTFYKTDDDIAACLAEKGVPQAVIEAIADHEGFTKTLHLSTVALKKIIPHLEAGHVYSEACALAGYDHSSPTSPGRAGKLPVIPQDSIRNPVVFRALAQARKVVNAVIDRYGPPSRVQIELARDMGRNAEERRKIKRIQDENRADNDALNEELAKELGRDPTGSDRLKLRLYGEQGGQCAYCGQSIDRNRLFEPNYAEIDHILPYSRSFDDSIANKVLAHWTCNQDKRNRTPYEAFGHSEKRWHDFEAWVRSQIRHPRKRANLLRESFDEKQEEEFKQRNLNDTSWIAREFSRFVRDNLAFADPSVKLPVVCVSGGITGRARGFWGLEKHREEDDLHHAVDAAVVAALLPHQVKLITEHAKVWEGRMQWRYIDQETGEVIEWVENKRPRLPLPWKGFREDLLGRLESVIVSRMPIRKMRGAIHADTIRSGKHIASQGVSVVRRPLTSLTPADLANLFAPETNEKLYAAIHDRLKRSGYDPSGSYKPHEFAALVKKAFGDPDNPLRKPTNDGSPGPIVKSVKVCQAQTTGVEVRGGIADNASMVRTDVFTKDGKYYLVPVYVADVLRGELPSRAVAAGKPRAEWPPVDSSYEFLFSLCQYDFVRIGTDRADMLGYYRGCDVDSGRVSISYPNNNARKPERLGARTAEVIEKFQMGVLGDYHPVRREVRRGLANRRNLEPGKAEG